MSSFNIQFTVTYCVVLLLGCTVHAQRLQRQTGHFPLSEFYPPIVSLQFSPDGKYLLSGGMDGYAAIWDIQTRRQIKEVGESGFSVDAVALSADNKVVTIAYAGTAITRHYLENNGQLRSAMPRMYNPFYWDVCETDQQTVVVSSENVFVLNPDLSFQGSFPGKNKRLKIACGDVCRHPNYVAIGLASGEIQILRYPELSIVKELPRFKSTAEKKFHAERLQFSDDGSLLVAISNQHHMRVFDVKNDFVMVLEKTLPFTYANRFPSLAITKDNRYAVFNAALIDLTTGDQLLQYDFSPMSVITFSPDGKDLAAGENPIRLIDVMTGKEVVTIDYFPVTDRLSFDVNEKWLAIHEGNNLSLFDNVNGLKYPVAIDERYDLIGKVSIQNNRLSIDVKDFSNRTTETYVTKRVILESKDDNFSNLHLVNETPISVIETKRFDDRTISYTNHSMYDPSDTTDAVWIATTFEGSAYADTLRLSDKQSFLSLSRNGNYAIQFGDPESEGGNLTTEENKFLYSFKIHNLKTGKEEGVHHFVYTDNVAARNVISVSDDGKYFYKTPSVIDTKRGVVVFDLSDNLDSVRTNFATFLSDNNTLLVILANHGIRLYDLQQKSLRKVLQRHGDPIIDYKLSVDETTLYTLKRDASVDRWDLAKGELVCTYYAMAEDGYGIIWSDGYFSASENGLEQFHYVNEMKPQTLANRELFYQRPDIISKRLGSVDQQLLNSQHQEHQEHLLALGLQESMLKADAPIPIVEVTNKMWPLESPDSLLNISWRADGRGSVLSRINFYLNGKALFGESGKALPNSSKKSSGLLSLPLVPGKNVVEVSVLTINGVESDRLRLVTYRPKLGLKEAKQK